MRYAALLILLLPSLAVAQDVTTTLPDSSVIVTELQSRIATLEAEKAALTAVVNEYAEEVKALQAKLARFEAHPTPAAKITMESIHDPANNVWCEACLVSDSIDRPRYERAGWMWETKKVPQRNGRRYPRYLVCIGDTCEVVEIRNLSELDGKIQALLDRRKK